MVRSNKHAPYAPLPREAHRFNARTGEYQLVQEDTRWPAWLRVLFIGGASLACWASIAFFALMLAAVIHGG